MDKKPETVVNTPNQKAKSNKLGKLILYTVGSALLILILYLYGVFSFIGVRIYSGDRITGQIYITVDGKEYLPLTAEALYNDNTISITTEESASPVSEVISGKTNKSKELLPVNTFAIKGEEEGIYTISYKLDKDKLYELTQADCFKNLKDDLIVHFKYNNKKWYYITTIKLNLTIKTDDNGITCNLNAYYFADNAERYKVSGTVDQPVRIEDLSKINELEFVIYK
jgi:hypothetical protein